MSAITPQQPDVAQAANLGPDDFVYLEKARLAAQRVGAGERDDVRPALAALKAAHFDADVPTASSRREIELLKTSFKRFSSWYTRHWVAQLQSFAARLVDVGDALAAKADRLQAGNDELSARVAAIEERLARLEQKSV